MRYIADCMKLTWSFNWLVQAVNVHHAWVMVFAASKLKVSLSLKIISVVPLVLPNQGRPYDVPHAEIGWNKHFIIKRTVQRKSPLRSLFFLVHSIFVAFMLEFLLALLQIRPALLTAIIFSTQRRKKQILLTKQANELLTLFILKYLRSLILIWLDMFQM